MELQSRLFMVLDCLIFVLASNSTNLSRQEILRRKLDENVYDSSIPPDFELNLRLLDSSNTVHWNYSTSLCNLKSCNAVISYSAQFALHFITTERLLTYIPTMIQVQLSLLNIHSVSETSMEYSIDIYLRQQWRDPRLEYGNLTSLDRLELDNKVMDKVWTPDTFFVNEKHAFVHNVTIPNKLMHLHRNGTVLYSMRVSLALTCYMLLQKYPLDQQRCPIIIESYAYTVGNIQYYWKPYDPVEISDSVEMPKFEAERHISISDCSRNYTSSRFSCIQAEIVLKRKVGYYIVQVFVPSILIVVLSWVGFWVDYGAVPARVSLGIMTVLTMTTQSSGAKQNLPHVSYIKAIDVWMATCLMFVFASLLEYAYVNVMARRPLPLSALMDNSNVSCNGVPDDPEKHRQPVTIKLESARLKIAARRIDKMSRIIFPVLFSIFNLIFWLYYTLSPDP